MRIVYTDHSARRMSDRGISKLMVEETLKSPDRMSTGYNNRSIAFKSFKEGIVKVIFFIENNDFVVITVMWE